ncbi:MAG: hypothetical protein ACHQRM_09615 [Bacteroidia bacterium]
MNKKLLISLFALILALSFPAQQFTKTKYKGDSVFVYPFPYYSWSYYDNLFCETVSGGHRFQEDGLFVTSIPLPDGKWIACYNNPKKSYEAYTKTNSPKKNENRIALVFTSANGKMNGSAVAYGRNGKRQAEGNYKDGEKEGSWNIYSLNGKELLEKVEYKKGIADGTWESYEKGKVKTRNHFKNGLTDGEQISYYPDGTIDRVVHFKNDKPDGDDLDYFLGGKLYAKSFYRNGHKIGWYRKWSKEGVLAEETHYYDGSDTLWEGGLDQFCKRTGLNVTRIEDHVKDGNSTTWWPNGKLKKREGYKLGLKIYGDTSYYDNGAISTMLKDSVTKDGKCRIRIERNYGKDGHLYYQSYCYKDSLLTYKRYYKTGKLESDHTEINIIDTSLFSINGFFPGIDQPRWVTTKEITFNEGFLRSENYYDPKTGVRHSSFHKKKGVQFSFTTDSAKLITTCFYNEKGIRTELRYRNRTKYENYWEERQHHVNARSQNFEGISGADSTITYHEGKPLNGPTRQNFGKNKYGKGILLQGRYEGPWTEYTKACWFQSEPDNKHHHIGKHKSAEVTFKANRREGTEISYDLVQDPPYPGHKHPFWYVHRSQEFRNGLAEGLNTTFYEDGKYLSKTMYHLGERNGAATSYFNNKQIEDSSIYVDGIRHGVHKRWNADGLLMLQTTFNQGKQNGKFQSYYFNGIREEEGTYKDDNRIGTWTHYFKGGTPNIITEYLTREQRKQLKIKKGIKRPVKEVRIIPRGRRNVFHEPEHGYEDNGNETQDCFTTYKYENGVKAQEGYVLNGERAGIWTWWREDGSKEKEVDYTAGVMITGSKDSLFYIGRYTSYYPGGERALEALIMNEESKYDCRKEVNDKLQNLYYLNAWNEQGQPVITAGSGYFKGKGAGGIVMSEGPVEKGLKNGSWLYRDENGNINNQGTYANGLMDGLWKEGDLAGIHSIENACYRNLSKMEMDELLRKLTVTEKWYLDGELQKTVRHKNQQHHYYGKRKLHPFSKHPSHIHFEAFPYSRDYGGDVF